MAASDANVFPPKNTAYRIPLSFRKNDGTLITGWTGAASVVATDASSGAGGTPTEIGSTGLGYLDLTSGQMNGELIQVLATVTNTDALPAIVSIYTGGIAEMQAALPTDASIATEVWATAPTIPTASEVATAVWGASITAPTDGHPTTYGPLVVLTLYFQRNLWTKVGETLSLYATGDTVMDTPLVIQNYSVSQTGFVRSEAEV